MSNFIKPTTRNNPNSYYCRDRRLTTYLLCVDGLKYLGSFLENETVYFEFEPASLAQTAVDAYYAYNTPPVQPRFLMDRWAFVTSEVRRLKGLPTYERKGELYK